MSRRPQQRLAEAIRFRTISDFSMPDQARRTRCAALQAHLGGELPGLPCRGEARDSSATTACSTHWEGSDPCREPDRAAGASGRGAGRAGHREGLAAAAVRAASSPMASSGAAAPGTTRATCIQSWRPPRRWRRRLPRRSGRSISPSATTRKSAGTRGAQGDRGAAGVARRASSTSCSTKGLLITERHC